MASKQVSKHWAQKTHMNGRRHAHAHRGGCDHTYLVQPPGPPICHNHGCLHTTPQSEHELGNGITPLS